VHNRVRHASSFIVDIDDALAHNLAVGEAHSADLSLEAPIKQDGSKQFVCFPDETHCGPGLLSANLDRRLLMNRCHCASPGGSTPAATAREGQSCNDVAHLTAGRLWREYEGGPLSAKLRE